MPPIASPDRAPPGSRNDLPVGHLVCDRGGVVRDANREAARLLGAEPAALLGQPLAGWLAPDDAPAWWRFLHGLPSDGPPHTADLTPRSATAPLRVIGQWAHLAASGAAPEAQETQACLVLLAPELIGPRPADDHDPAADRLAAWQARFLAAAAHDMRQPFNALSLFLGILRASSTLERALEIAGKMQAPLDAVVALFNGLIEVTRVELGLVAIDRRAVAMTETLAPIADELDEAATGAGVRLALVPCRRTIETDPRLFTELIRQLALGAVRSCDSGRRVVVGVRRAGAQLRLEVVDNGAGIAPEDVAHVFEPFHRARGRAAGRKDGHGLDLWAARRLAELLGYRLEIASVLGRGTRLSVVIDTA